MFYGFVGDSGKSLHKIRFYVSIGIKKDVIVSAFGNFGHVPKGYIHTSQDHTVSPALQNAWS